MCKGRAEPPDTMTFNRPPRFCLKGGDKGGGRREDREETKEVEEGEEEVDEEAEGR